MNSLVTYPCR